MHCEEMLSPKLILKPFATNPVAPIASAGYPFEPEKTMEMKEQHVDHRCHEIKAKIITASPDSGHKGGNIITKPKASARSEVMWEGQQSLQNHRQFQLGNNDIALRP